MNIVPATITDRKKISDFVKAGTTAAKLCAHWIPRLEMELKNHLSQKNPYFKHAECRFFTAYENGRPVGRISAQIDRQNPNTNDGKIGHFGYCAATRPDIFKALLNEAENWLKSKNCNSISGPYSLSINDEPGLLVSGFDKSQRILMNYAPQWMHETLESRDYKGIKDLLAYDLPCLSDLPENAQKMVRHAELSKEIFSRPVRANQLTEDLEIIRGIFNQAWANNWGFIPMSQDDIAYMAHNLKPVIDTDLAHIAFFNDKPAAMIVALPNINEAINGYEGRLFPLNWLNLIWRLKVSGLKSARVVLMGVIPDYQSGIFGSALSLLLISRVHAAIREKNMEVVELSWILEDNMAIRRLIESIGGTITRRYRIYKKHLI